MLHLGGTVMWPRGNCQRKKPSFVLYWFQSSQRPRKNSIFLVFFLVFSWILVCFFYLFFLILFWYFFKPNGGTLLGATKRVHKHAWPLPLPDSQPGPATWHCKSLWLSTFHGMIHRNPSCCYYAGRLSIHGSITCVSVTISSRGSKCIQYLSTGHRCWIIKITTHESCW